MTYGEMEKLAREFAHEMFPNDKCQQESAFKMAMRAYEWLRRTHYLVSKDSGGEVTLKGNLARDESGMLAFYPNDYPQRRDGYWTADEEEVILPSELFPAVKWTSDPLLAKIIIIPLE